MLRSLALTLVSLALVVPAAQAQGTATGAGTVERAAAALRSDPVYVDPGAVDALSPAAAQRLQQRIAEKEAGPMYVAVLPADARDEAGGDTGQVLREIAASVGRPGVYAVLAGKDFEAGATRGSGFDSGQVPELATEAFRAEASGGPEAVLRDFVDRVAAAKTGQGGSGSGSDGGGSGGLVLLAVLGGGAALLAVRRSRRRRRQQVAQLAELRDTAREDLIALGDDVRALDLDVQMPNADATAKEDYGHAVERYQEAERQLDKARTPEDFRPVGEALEEGRFNMASAKARLGGQEPPERRPPCFFDPRHGPSTREVEWAPDGYQSRLVPVCEADAVRIEQGDEPMSREVVAHGRRMPYYAAPAYFGPYAGGFFGAFGGLIPGLFLGSMVSGAMFPGAAWGDAGAGQDAGGDFGGDFGDVGGDFGGGDFGGGDFGGGGDF